MRRLDILTIRHKYRMTQKELSSLTGFPQGYISKMECGKVSTPEAFIQKVSEVLKIEDIDSYISFDKKNNEPESVEETDSLPVIDSNDQITLKAFQMMMQLLEKREARIEKLENEVDSLRKEIIALSLKTSTQTSTL